MKGVEVHRWKTTAVGPFGNGHLGGSIQRSSFLFTTQPQDLVVVVCQGRFLLLCPPSCASPRVDATAESLLISLQRRE